MGLRYFKRWKLAPGITVNMSTSGLSLSLGETGARVTVGPRGVRSTLGIPGTGLHYSTQHPWKSGARRAPVEEPIKDEPAGRRADAVFDYLDQFERPPEERIFHDSYTTYASGDSESAVATLLTIHQFPAAAFMLGLVLFQRTQFADAIKHLLVAFEDSTSVRTVYEKYRIDPCAQLNVSPECTVVIGPDHQGILLLLVEAYQRLEEWRDANHYLKQLLEKYPDEVVVKLSAIEFVLSYQPDSKSICNRVVNFSNGVTNESPVHGALMLYRGIAMLELDKPTAACEIFSELLRRTKDRPVQLLYAARYYRALAYEELGQPVRARKDLERIYATAADYRDVATRLNAKS